MEDLTTASGKRLAPYAADPARSRGRVHPESPPQGRDEFQRDRDRIVHSAAFRRLEYKTQVFVNHEGDLFRTRLTHSIEVAQIARTIARQLRLNEDLTEAISLAHDLGHTPFGHAGQDALHGLRAGARAQRRQEGAAGRRRGRHRWAPLAGPGSSAHLVVAELRLERAARGLQGAAVLWRGRQGQGGSSC